MRRDTAVLYEWGEGMIYDINYNAFSDENILHRWRFEGEIQTAPARDRILCYDPPEGRMKDKGYIIDVHRAWIKLTPKPKECIFGKYVMTQILKDDGNPYTAKEDAKIMQMKFDTFIRNVSRGRTAINSKVKL